MAVLVFLWRAESFIPQLPRSPSLFYLFIYLFIDNRFLLRWTSEPDDDLLHGGTALWHTVELLYGTRWNGVMAHGGTALWHTVERPYDTHWNGVMAHGGTALWHTAERRYGTR